MSSTTQPKRENKEDEKEPRLRRILQIHLASLSNQGPLKPTYQHLLPPMTNNYKKTSTKHMNEEEQTAHEKKENLYKNIRADLRNAVELHLHSNHHIKKRGRERADLEETPMRAAFTLRECKIHEQEPLVTALLKSGGVVGAAVPSAFESGQMIPRRLHMEGTALWLQEQEKKEQLRIRMESVKRQRQAEEDRAKSRSAAAQKDRSSSMMRDQDRHNHHHSSSSSKDGGGSSISRADMVELKRKKEEEMRLRAKREEERDRERTKERLRERERTREALKAKEEMERKASIERDKAEADRLQRERETPQQALRRVYEPIFRALWNMEFDNLHGTNPFRIVIDADNCAMMGVPDYADIVKKPMNLTYIQAKVDGQKYEQLGDFFKDVDLMISNALLYNSDEKNDFHVAALKMKKKYKKMAKMVIKSLQMQQKQESSK